MKIEAGKRYKTRNGLTVGPMVMHLRSGTFAAGMNGDEHFWYPTGSYLRSGESVHDLVEEVREPRRFWVNEYSSGALGIFRDKAAAERSTAIPARCIELVEVL